MKYKVILKNVAFASQQSNVFELDKKSFFIGRSDTSDIEIPSKYTSISRRHLVIKCRDNKVYLSDLGSSNGTYLDNRKLIPNKFYEWKTTQTVKISSIYISLHSSSNSEKDTNKKNNGFSKMPTQSGKNTSGKVKTRMLDEPNIHEEGIRFISKISEGGMSEIIKSQFLDTKETVAIKIPNKTCISNPIALKNFMDEIKMSLHFQHINIIQTYMKIQYHSHPAMVMEYFPSQTLRCFIKNQPIKLDVVREIVLQLLDGLHYIHRRSILHNDIKPSNILVNDDNIVKISDFGAAYKRSKHLPKQIIGTISYMSPERIKNGNSSSVQSDIFSLGVVLYELYTKQHPFFDSKTNITTDTIKNSITTGKINPPVNINPGISFSLNSFILRCLEKDTSIRFKNVEEIKEAFLTC